MDAVTTASSVQSAQSAASGNKGRRSRRTRSQRTVRMRNPLLRRISITEHGEAPGSLQCRHCHKILTTARTFREHINRRHTKEVAFLCNVTGCGYKSFSHVAICNHDRTLHNCQRNFSINFRRPEMGTYQARVVAASSCKSQTNLRSQGDTAQNGAGGSGAFQGAPGNQRPCSQVRSATNNSCTLTSGSAQGTAAKSSGDACASVRLTGAFQAIYDAFEQKLNALQVDLKLFD